MQAIFGTRGRASCQVPPLQDGAAGVLRVDAARGASTPPPRPDLARRPGSPETGGLVAHLDGVHVGWCAVEPRCNDESLLRDQDGCWAGGVSLRCDRNRVFAMTSRRRRRRCPPDTVSTILHHRVLTASGRSPHSVEVAGPACRDHRQLGVLTSREPHSSCAAPTHGQRIVSRHGVGADQALRASRHP